AAVTASATVPVSSSSTRCDVDPSSSGDQPTSGSSTTIGHPQSLRQCPGHCASSAPSQSSPVSRRPLPQLAGGTSSTGVLVDGAGTGVATIGTRCAVAATSPPFGVAVTSLTTVPTSGVVGSGAGNAGAMSTAVTIAAAGSA